MVNFLKDLLLCFFLFMKGRIEREFSGESIDTEGERKLRDELLLMLRSVFHFLTGVANSDFGQSRLVDGGARGCCCRCF